MFDRQNAIKCEPHTTHPRLPPPPPPPPPVRKPLISSRPLWYFLIWKVSCWPFFAEEEEQEDGANTVHVRLPCRALRPSRKAKRACLMITGDKKKKKRRAAHVMLLFPTPKCTLTYSATLDMSMTLRLVLNRVVTASQIVVHGRGSTGVGLSIDRMNHTVRPLCKKTYLSPSCQDTFILCDFCCVCLVLLFLQQPSAPLPITGFPLLSGTRRSPLWI